MTAEGPTGPKANALPSWKPGLKAQLERDHYMNVGDISKFWIKKIGRGNPSLIKELIQTLPPEERLKDVRAYQYGKAVYQFYPKTLLVQIGVELARKNPELREAICVTLIGDCGVGKDEAERLVTAATAPSSESTFSENDYVSAGKMAQLYQAGDVHIKRAIEMVGPSADVNDVRKKPLGEERTSVSYSPRYQMLVGEYLRDHFDELLRFGGPKINLNRESIEEGLEDLFKQFPQLRMLPRVAIERNISKELPEKMTVGFFAQQLANYTRGNSTTKLSAIIRAWEPPPERRQAPGNAKGFVYPRAFLLDVARALYREYVTQKSPRDAEREHVAQGIKRFFEAYNHPLEKE